MSASRAVVYGLSFPSSSFLVRMVEGYRTVARPGTPGRHLGASRPVVTFVTRERLVVAAMM